MEVWSESVYLGSAGIGNIAKGECFSQSLARSIEVSGRKTTVTTLVIQSIDITRTLITLGTFPRRLLQLKLKTTLVRTPNNST
jgi:hypothetical protein